MNRIPPREAEEGVISCVRLHPGCSKAYVTGSGWPVSALERVIERGLIRAERPGGRGAYKLYPADGTGEDG